MKRLLPIVFLVAACVGAAVPGTSTQTQPPSATASVDLATGTPTETVLQTQTPTSTSTAAPTSTPTPTPATITSAPSLEPTASSDWSALEPLYAALRPENGQTLSGRTVFTSGEPDISLTYDLVNHSTRPVVLPYLDYYGTKFHLAGVEQTWIERLGPDPTIPCMESAGRKGTWYATGGEIIASDLTSIAPEGSLPRSTVLYSASTECFPSGPYRYHIEYKPLDADPSNVIGETVIDLEFAAPAQTPSPSL